MTSCYQHQAITRTNVYLSSSRSSGIHLMANFRGNTKDIIHKNMFESFIFRITATSVMQQWVNCGQTLESHRLLRFTFKDHINIPICIISIIAVDDLAIQGSRASPTMTLTQLASRYSRPYTMWVNPFEAESRIFWVNEVNTSVGNTHWSASLRPTTLEKDWELFVDFSSILFMIWDSSHEDLQLFGWRLRPPTIIRRDGCGGPQYTLLHSHRLLVVGWQWGW